MIAESNELLARITIWLLAESVLLDFANSLPPNAEGVNASCDDIFCSEHNF